MERDVFPVGRVCISFSYISICHVAHDTYTFRRLVLCYVPIMQPLVNLTFFPDIVKSIMYIDDKFSILLTKHVLSATS